MPEENKSSAAWLAFLPQILIGAAIIIGGFIVYGFLKSLGIIGTSKEKEDATQLAQDISLSQNTINALNQVDNKFREAIKAAVIKKYGMKATPANVKDYTTNILIPNQKNFGDFVNQILDAYSKVGTNDVGKIMGVFKNLKSQFEVNDFATFYQIFTTSAAGKKLLPKSSLGGDMYSALNNLMFDSDMSTLRTMINNKPLI